MTIKIPKTDGVADPSSAASSAVPSSSTHGRKRKSTKMLTKYPSIKASHVEQLSVLVESIPSYPPSEKLVAAWAKLLKATPEDVRRWAMDKVEAEGMSGTDPLAPSVSSEPVERRAAAAVASDSEDEPLMMHTPIPSQASSVSSAINPTLAHNPYRTLVTPTYPVHPLPPPHPVRHVPPREQLLLAIHNSIHSESSSPLPIVESSMQFNELFAPYETMMEGFIKDVEAGRLESWNINSLST